MTSDERLARIREVMAMMVADCEADAMALDGKAFDGRTVGENFGNLYAAVQALARAVEVLAGSGEVEPA